MHALSGAHAFIDEPPRAPSVQWETKRGLAVHGNEVFSLYFGPENFLLIFPSRNKETHLLVKPYFILLLLSYILGVSE